MRKIIHKLSLIKLNFDKDYLAEIIEVDWIKYVERINIVSYFIQKIITGFYIISFLNLWFLLYVHLFFIV